MGLPMSITVQDLELAWDDVQTHLAMRGADVGQLVRDIGFDENALHKFTDERGESMRAAGERNGLSSDKSHATATLHGILIGFLLGAQNPEAF